MIPFRRALPALLLLAGAAPAGAHEFWLSPSRYSAVAADTVSVGAQVGTGFRGEAKPYAASRVQTLVAVGARRIDLAKVGLNGDFVFARWITGDGGGQLVGYQSDFATIELPAREFDRYLELEGLDAPLAARRGLGARAGPGRERYARCPKTWIAGSEPRRAGVWIGLPIEIAPLGDPGAAGPLRVAVRWRGRPLAGALVGAWNMPLAAGLAPRDPAARDSVPPLVRVRTGRDGVAVLPLERAGEWMIATVQMVPCAERAVADWESWWASLTFARATRPEGR